ncbi:MAG: FecR domain-containing protein, partial [Gemmatimonadaceae bacterium]
MARDDELDWILLVRYFAGEATPSERAQLESWAAAHPERAEELAALRQVWTDAGHIPSKARIDSMWTELLRRARSTGASPPVTERHAIGNLEIARGSAAQRPVRVLRFPPERRTAAYWRLTTAALAASTVIAVGMKWLGGKQDAPGVGATATQPALREFATARGQRATIRLLDGTRVELGYASTLRVAPFRAGRRELWLEGEAIFDVIHDERRPFVVHAANAITQDLGTLFSVRAYPDDDDVRVVVVSGLVSLRAKRGTVDSPNASGGTRN